MTSKYYYLFLLFPLFTHCFSYVHLLERTIASFDENPINIKSCKNCKYFIENDSIEFSRCSKFIKPKNRNRFSSGQEYRPPFVQYIKVNHPNDFNNNNNINKYNAMLLFYLAKTCRNNNMMCGEDAKYYERRYSDIY
jgi:hypothetical protein